MNFELLNNTMPPPPAVIAAGNAAFATAVINLEHYGYYENNSCVVYKNFIKMPDSNIILTA